MSQQRIEHGAEQAVTTDADAGDGQGLASPGAHPGGGRVGGGTTATDDLETPIDAEGREGDGDDADSSSGQEVPARSDLDDGKQPASGANLQTARDEGAFRHQ